MTPISGPRAAANRHRLEPRIYDLFSSHLSDEYLVIHRPRWVGKSIVGQPLSDGHVHFLVAHPERGILVLNIHHGGLAYDPHGDTWRQHKSGQGRVIPSPYAALSEQTTALRRQMEQHPSATPTCPVMGYGLVVPGIVAPAAGWSAEIPAALTLDIAALDHWSESIERIYEHWAMRSPARGNASARWWWRVLEDLFFAPREVRVRLGHRLERDRQDILSLGDRQMQVLDMLARVRRQTIFGSAGTGKTVLAIEKARALSEQGMRVLLTCYNKGLGRYLRDAVEDCPAITAVHFHELCYELAGLEERSVEPPKGRQEQRTFYDQTLPQYLTEASANLSPLWDALVVDEGQDFLDPYWRALDSLCVDPERAIRYIFFDDGQVLRDRPDPVPSADTALVLRTNWRNSKSIVKHLSEVEPRLRELPCAAPEGVPVDFEPLTPTLRDAVARVLTRLVKQGGVAVEDIVVLCGRSPTRSKIMALKQPIAGVHLSATEEPATVRVRSIHGYKGLEAPVVILSDLQGYPPEKARQLYYVGASRAMNHLVVLGDADLRADMEARSS